MRKSNVARAVTKILRPFVRLPRVVQACILGSVFAVLMFETRVHQEARETLGDEAMLEEYGFLREEAVIAVLSPVTINAVREMVAFADNGEGRAEGWTVVIREAESLFSFLTLEDTDSDGAPNTMSAGFATFRGTYSTYDSDEDGVVDRATFALWKNADGIVNTGADGIVSTGADGIVSTGADEYTRYQYWDLDCDGKIDQVGKIDRQGDLDDGRDLEKRQFIVFENHWLPCAGIEDPTESDTHRHSIEVGGEWMWVDFADGRWQTEKIPREGLPE